QQLVDVDADAGSVDRVEGVLGVDERSRPALPLRLGDHVKRQRRLACGLGSVELGDAALGNAPHSQRQVEQQRSGRDHGDLTAQRGLFAQLHDRTLSIALHDLGHGRVEGFFLFLCRCLLGGCGECCTSRSRVQSLLYRRRDAHLIEQVFVSQAVLTWVWAAARAAWMSSRSDSPAACRRFDQRSPLKLYSWLEVAAPDAIAMYVSPTGLLVPSDSGPAIPVTAAASVEPNRERAPSAIASATWALTAPYLVSSPAPTPSRSRLALSP